MAAKKARILIRGGRVIDPASHLDAEVDVAVAAGRIAGIGETVPGDFRPELEIDARGLIVCPGLVELAAHLREPGHENKATIASETRAAAAGGITTLCCPPTTDPIIDTPAVVELIRQRAERAGHARVVTLGALTQQLAGEHLTEMAALKEAGCRGVSNAQNPILHTAVVRRAFEYAATFDLTVFIHPEEYWLANGGCAHEGAVATRLGLPGIPAAAETAAVARDLALIEHTGVRAHFCRLTHSRSVQMIARAQYDGVPVTADAAIPYLYFTELDIADFDSQFHVYPPLRTQRDREGLRAGLARGTLSALCSDHQPHEADAKLNPFPATEPGISGLDTLLPLALRLVEDKLLTLPEIIDRLTVGPARILGLLEQGTGTLNPGAAADITVFDPEASWRIDPASLFSQGHNTPFMGWEVKGRVMHTLLGGRRVFER